MSWTPADATAFRLLDVLSAYAVTRPSQDQHGGLDFAESQSFHFDVRALRSLRRACGLCVWCGVPAEPGRPLCAAHLAAARLASRAWARRNAEAQARVREDRRRRGLCVRCGERAAPDRALCRRHLDAAAAYARARVARFRDGVEAPPRRRYAQSGRSGGSAGVG